MMSCRAIALFVTLALPTAAETPVSLLVRGQSLPLHLYGAKEGQPVVVSSGDGGWVHLAPDVAGFLEAQGYFVVGVDSKAYLSSFTHGKATLAPGDVPAAFAAFVDYARHGRAGRVPLIGISEGAGLSVLAAADPTLQPLLTGVLGLGLPDVNELGWRWKDQVIYITKGVPNEPTFRAADYVGKLGSLPLAAIHSSHDEFVPLEEVKRLLEPQSPTRRLWVVEATDHRFSGNQAELRQRILEALAWMGATTK